MVIFFIIFFLQEIKEQHALEIQLLEDTNDISYARQEIEERSGFTEESSLLEVSEVLDQMDIRRKNFINHIDSDYYRRLVSIKNGDTVQNIPPVS